MAGLPVSSACVRVGPPLNASGPTSGSVASRLPAPDTEITQPGGGQIVSIRDLVALIVNAGIVVRFVATSPPLPWSLARIDETSVIVGVTALSAVGGVVAPVLIRIPPVWVGGATLPLTVELSSSCATFPYTNIAPAVALDKLPEIVELMIFTANKSAGACRSAALLNKCKPPPRVTSAPVTSATELPAISERRI